VYKTPSTIINTDIAD